MGTKYKQSQARQIAEAAIRTEMNTSICCGIHDRMSHAEQSGIQRLLEERDSDGTTQFNRMTQTLQGPSWSHFKRLFTHLEWLDKLGNTAVRVARVASPKVTDLAGEADAADASELRDYVAVKRVAMKIKKAKEELEGIRLAEREIVEASSSGLHGDPTSAAQAPDECDAPRARQQGECGSLVSG